MGSMVRQAEPAPVPGVVAGVSQNGRNVPSDEGSPVRRPLLAVLAAVLLLAGVGSVPAAQADGPAPKRVASGWLPYWMTSPGARTA